MASDYGPGSHSVITASGPKVHSTLRTDGLVGAEQESILRTPQTLTRGGMGVEVVSEKIFGVGVASAGRTDTRFGLARDLVETLQGPDRIPSIWSIITLRTGQAQ